MPCAGRHVEGHPPDCILVQTDNNGRRAYARSRGGLPARRRSDGAAATALTRKRFRADRDQTRRVAEIYRALTFGCRQVSSAALMRFERTMPIGHCGTAATTRAVANIAASNSSSDPVPTRTPSTSHDRHTGNMHTAGNIHCLSRRAVRYRLVAIPANRLSWPPREVKQLHWLQRPQRLLCT